VIAERRFRIVGRLSPADHGGTPRIEAWDRDSGSELLVGAADTTPEGTYVLEFGTDDERRPDVFLRATLDGRTIATSEDDVRWNLRPGETRIDLVVAAAPVVAGRVLDELHRPAAGLVVHLEGILAGGGRERLGTTRSDEDGRYTIAYASDEPLDVEVSVEGHEPVVRYALAGYAVVDLVLSDTPWQGPSLAERVTADAELVNEGATLDARDAQRIAARTGADPATVTMLATAGAVATALEIPTDLAFAFVGNGLPTEPDALLATPPAALRAAIHGAVETNQVPRRVLADADAAITRLRDRRVAALLDDQPEGAVATLRDALTAGGVRARAEQEQVVAAYVEGHGDVAPELRLAFELADLTHNNVPLIRSVRRARSPRALSELADLDAAAWEELIADAGAPVPPTIARGSRARRRSAYADALAERVEAAFPAKALLARAARDPNLPAQGGLAKFTAAHPEFALDGVPVRQYLAENDVEAAVEVVTTVESLQRLLPLAPRYANASALVADGLDSSLAITQLGEATFVGRHAATFGDDDGARLVHRMASARAAGAVQILLRHLDPNTVYAIEPPPDPPFSIPDWESLFGSADFCECQHCASVVGPAAYLTDILHFLEQRPATQNRNAKDVLFARRPDLGEVELTCENTNTTLPYLDLVNEVLEAAVAPRGFTLDWGVGPDLNNGELTSHIRDAFAQAGWQLPADADLHVETVGRQWCIRYPGWRHTIATGPASLSVTTTPQTSGSSREQDANPEHVHPPAYAVLRTRVYPWMMPFDLWLEEVRAFLATLGVRRAELMEDLGGVDAGAIAAERLGLGGGERALLTGAGAPVRDAWGGVGASWVAPLRNVRTLLDRSGMRYEELAELLRLRWINPGEALRIESSDPADPHTADTTKLTITALDADALDRIHRFLRLRTRLPWSDVELDRALTLLPGGALDDEALTVLADLEAFRRELGLDVATLLTLFARLDTHRYRDAEGAQRASVYHELFRSRSVVQPVPGQHDRFALNAGGTELELIPVLSVTPADAEPVRREVEETRAAVAGALGVAGAELALLLEGPDAILGSPPVADLESLSSLRRHALLARALGLEVADLLALKRLVGIDPFVAAAAAISPQDTARLRFFLDAVRAVERSEASIAELDYLLTHRVDPQAPLEPPAELLTAELEGLRETLRAIRDDTRPLPDPVGQGLARKLVGAGWTDKDARAAREMLSGTAVYRAPLVAVPAGVTLPADLAIRFAAGELEFTGAMTTDQRATLSALTQDAAFQDAASALFAAPRTQATALLATFPSSEPLLSAADIGALLDTALSAQERFESVLARVDAHLRRTRGAQAVTELLAGVLELSVPSVSVLLTRWAYDPAGAQERLLARFVDPAFVDSAQPVVAANFPELVRARLLLGKVADVAGRWSLPAVQLELLLANAAELGWLDLATLPIASGDAPASLQPWLKMSTAFAWQGELSATADTVLDLLVAALHFDPAGLDPEAEKRALLERWSRLTGWRSEDLRVLLGGDDPADAGLLGLGLPAAAGDWNSWINEETWLRVRRCIDAMKVTGASLAACVAWARETVTQGDARNARQAARARHTPESWPEVVAPISDTLRARRRDALVGELVARPVSGAAPRDADDLFAWFLIDVEMAPCMTTSRLKQAISSVQLFAQRCLMNLERDVPMGTDPAWAQWRWMKTYRVWEAARRIFLWPENWVQPELRDDKSPPFRELEEALAQTDLDEEAAADGLQAYLERLEEVALLDVVGIYEDRADAPSPATREVHVIARTRATPPSYYYRKRVDGSRWTPWERVDADLEGDYVLPVVWNGRVHLLWPIISEFQPEGPLTIPEAGGAMAKPPKRLLIQLAWTQRKGATWTPKQLTRYKLYPPDMSPSDKRQLALAAQLDAVGDLVVQVLHLPATNLKRYAVQHFRLSAATGTGTVNEPGGRSIDGFLSNLGWSQLTSHTVAPGIRIENMSHYELAGGALQGIDSSLTPVTLLAATPGPAPFRVRAQDFPRLGITKPLVFADGERSFYFEPSRDKPTGVSGQMIDRLQPYAFHHPRVRGFARTLRRSGLDGLYARAVQTASAADLTQEYGPGPTLRPPFPVDDVDFAYDGAYGGYNWELFFHAPLLIADRLMVNQRFEEAQRWLHRIFDPTDRSSVPAPQRFWRTRPFFEVTAAQSAAERDVAAIPDAVLSDQVKRWRSDPFNPHAVARMRHTSYQRATVMKYLDNLIGWGDQLFRRDTIESLNEATQLYVLAAEILGRRPETVPARARPIPQTYRSIAPKLDAFSNAIVAAESLLPPLEVEPLEPDDPIDHAPITLPMRYFCIPRNDKLLSYWDTVGDRLFKLRHCMNIEGVERQLALFEPPIDPAMLVSAAAAGIDVGAAVGEAAAPLPPYRFSALAQKATELCGQVQALGSGLLSALEKRDAEMLAALRADQEIAVLDAVRGVRELALQEAQRNIEALDVSRELTTIRRDYYAGLQFVNAGEALHLAMSASAAVMQAVAGGLESVAGAVAIVPEFKLGAPTSIGASFGGSNLSGALHAISGSIAAAGTLMQGGANLAQTMGGYERRAEEWKYQVSLAAKELELLERQRVTSQVRVAVAERELANHDLQARNATSTKEVMEDKFTNRQLYDWMVGQVSGLYFRAFQLAYDVAKRAERAYRYELGVQESNFIRFGSWDSLRKGLLAGERLTHEVKRMESSWLDEHHRNFELTKTVSLAILDPAALVRLRETGSCFVTLPEGLFDLDHPGHYMRRLKSVSLSIPAVAGPYTNVNATLTLIASRVRTAATAAGAYPFSGVQDTRFAEMTTAVQSIATSHGQRDAGLFEVDFDDDRYLPFEGQGAISEWRLELDPDGNRFDLRTVSDVLVHVSYTARDGGSALRTKAKAMLPRTQLVVVDARRELPSAWTRFMHPPDAAIYDELVLDLARFVPFRAHGAGSKVARVDLYARIAPKGTTTVPDLPLELQTGTTAGATDLLAGAPLTQVPALGLSVASAVPVSARVPAEWVLRVRGASVPAALRRTVRVGAVDYYHLDEAAMPDLYLVLHYVPG
jgi:hypothetical protein